MFCYKCGREISEQGNFCPYCGAEQTKTAQQPLDPEEKVSGKQIVGQVLRRVLLVFILVPLVILGIFVVAALFADDEEEQSQAETTAVTMQTVPQKSTTAEYQIPEDGWHEEAGDRYYFRDGLMYVGLQEIDGDMYYFNKDGVLAVNRDVDQLTYVLEAGVDGRIEGITYDQITGDWAEEDYHFGYGGSSAIMELPAEMENCDSFTFFVEANGEYGAKVNGDWKVYIRQKGEWEFVQKIDYKEPKGYFKIEFDEPKTFDAITAHPTVQGNASYSSWFSLINVHCLF